MSGIGVISNPHSKANRKHPGGMEQLTYIMGQTGTHRITKSLEELSDVCVYFCEKGVDVLAINGGDGTIGRTLSSIIKAYSDAGKQLPRVALLGGGTINVLVKNLGLSTNPQKNLFKLCETYSHGAEQLKISRIPTLKIEDHYGFLFADGLSYDFLEEFYKGRKTPIRSLLMVTRLVLSVLLGGQLGKRIVRWHSRRIRINKGIQEERKFLSVMASTIPKMPFGVKLFRKMQKAPLEKLEMFEYALFKTHPSRAWWRLPWMLSRFEKISKDDRTSGVATVIELESEKEPFKLTLDGELIETKSSNITIELGPEVNIVLY